MFRISLLMGLFLLCLGCSVGPDYQRPQDFSDDEIARSLGLSSQSGTLIRSDWYKEFHDETLNKLAEKGLKESPTVQKALANMKQARYQLFIERAGFLPSFDLQGKYLNSKENGANHSSLKSEYYLAGLDASWEIDIWGGQRRLTEQAKAIFESAAANYDDVRLSLLSEIAAEYMNWRLAQKTLFIVEKNLELQREIFETVKEQYSAGLADELAYEQAQSVLHTTEMKVPTLRTQEKAAQNALSVLTGQLPADFFYDKKNILDQPDTFDIALFTDLPADIIRNRPDVQAAEQNLVAQNALIGHAVAQLFPSVSLSALLGYQNGKLSPLIGPDFDAHSASAVVSLPLLHWGALINQVRAQKEATRSALADYQLTLLTAASELSNSIKSIKEEKIRNKAAQKSMLSTEKILKLSRQKYQSGLIEFSDVLTAEQNKLEAEQAYLQSTASIYLNIISFFKAAGGGFALNRNTPACRKDAKAAACAPCTN